MTEIAHIIKLIDAYGANCYNDGANDADHPNTDKARNQLIESICTELANEVETIRELVHALEYEGHSLPDEDLSPHVCDGCLAIGKARKWITEATK